MRISNGVKIAVIGVGGRTGTMFAFELQKAAEVLGVGKEVDKIQRKEFFVEREENPPELFEGKIVDESQFPYDFSPEIIFLTTKNPVGPVVKYYYQRIKDHDQPSPAKNFTKQIDRQAHPKKEKSPALVLSQNGITAGEEALKALKEILDEEAREIQIIRVSLFNPIEKKTINGKIYISYFLPIRLSFGVISGSKETTKIKELFKKAGIEAEEVLPENVKNMEFSKLFFNLIGIPSAIRGLSIREGFKDLEIFKEEIEALREYIKVVREVKGNFLNLRKAPIKLLASLIYYFPLSGLILLRRQFGRLIDKERGWKPKGNLDEVDYYNGAVVKLGKEFGISTPVNEEILKRVNLINLSQEE